MPVHLPRPGRLATAAVSVAATASLTLTGVAFAHGHTADHGGDQGAFHGTHPVEPPAQPTSDKKIQNIDQVRTAIKAYYGDTPTTTPDPVNGATTLHTFDPHGAYARQVSREAEQAGHFLRSAVHGHGGQARHSDTPAIVLDVDDTTLNTYNYEIYSNFAYNPTTNAAFVNSAAFPAVPGMPDLARLARQQGYDVFFLTGRPGTQRAGTVTNLANAGYGSVDADHLYLKDYTADTWLSSCAPSCTTIQYKTLTRAHIESLGYDVVADFGDQYSDLEGGHAGRRYKLPNPMYYLP